MLINPSVLVVIPSIRNVDPFMLDGIPNDVRVLVVEDRDHGVINIDDDRFTIMDHTAAKQYIGANRYWLIDQGSSACRSFGYYYAYREGFQYVITLDDDCYTRPSFWPSLWFNRQSEPCWPKATLTGDARWVNTIPLGPSRRFARGYPPDYRNGLTFLREGRGHCDAIMAQMGLWSGHLDLSAADKLTCQHEWSDIHIAAVTDAVVDKGKFFPWCGMNYTFDIRLAPALMHWHSNKDPQWDRYDDIWAGYVAKHLLDKNNHGVIVGNPVVDHAKSGDITKEWVRERYCESISHWLYPLIDEAMTGVGPSPSYAQQVYQFANTFRHLLAKSECPPMWSHYLMHMSCVLSEWAELYHA